MLLNTEVRAATGGTIRVGHLHWMYNVVYRGRPAHPVPVIAPPPGFPYDVRHDHGVPLVRRYMVALADGKLVEAYDYLRRGADAKSPICMATYGLAALCGDIPGHEPDPGAITTLEKAAERDGSWASLGFLLIEGEYVPQDIDRGLALVKREIAQDSEFAAVDLAMIYEHGKYGMTRDHAKAVQLVLHAAPQWRRLAAHCGLSQETWATSALRARDNIESTLAARSGGDTQRDAQRLVKNLRNLPRI